MKRRSFLFATASLPLLGSVPPYFPAPLLVKPKVILLRTAVDFDLTPIFMSGALVHYEAASNTIRVDLAAEYDDGSVRNFTCDNQTWHYETRKCESHVVIGKDIVVYYRGNSCDQSDGNMDLITTVCTFKNVREVFDGV
jgi:hypothetical protein